MLARPSVAVVPADRRASAIRRFPPGCGRRRRHNAAATRLPHADPLPITSSSSSSAAAAAKPPLPNPSIARAAHKAAPPRPRRADSAAAASGAEGNRRGVESGRKAPAAAAVNVRSVSAVRRYPPGCGRGDAVSKRKAPVGEAGAAGAQEKPWVVNGLMAVPFMPWAQHGRRKSQPNA
nr:unnamed protein product [Digitaria exilis]